MAESPRSPVPDSDLLFALQKRIASGKLDIGTALWQVASSGSTETLELVLQLPNGRNGYLARDTYLGSSIDQ